MTVTKKTYDKEKYTQIMIKKKTKNRLNSFNSIVYYKKKESYISYDEEINFFMDEFENQLIHVTLNKLSMRLPVSTTVNYSNNTIIKRKLSSVTIK